MNDKYPLLENYYCSYHNKFFDELSNYDLVKCECDDCNECTYCLEVHQLDRLVKFVDDEIVFLSLKK